jgi:hypothetical protein
MIQQDHFVSKTQSTGYQAGADTAVWRYPVLFAEVSSPTRHPRREITLLFSPHFSESTIWRRGTTGIPAG